MAEEEVKLYGMWASPYSLRIELALKLKGIPYEYIEEDLRNKSPSLVKHNPVFKKVPVLVHNGKPISESLIILEYIDETWKNNPILLPQDPYERATARFWAKFIDDKILGIGGKAYLAEGTENEDVKEFYELLKTFENELKGKDFYGGDSIGYVDIVAILVGFFLPVTQEVVGAEILTEEKFPVLFKWIGRLQDIDAVNECRPPRERNLAYVRAVVESIKSAPK